MTKISYLAHSGGYYDVRSTALSEARYSALTARGVRG